MHSCNYILPQYIQPYALVHNVLSLVHTFHYVYKYTYHNIIYIKEHYPILGSQHRYI